MHTHSIYHDLVVEADAAKLFAVVSEPQHLINWWPLRCKGVCEQGAEYNFFFEPKYDWYGTVSKLIPNQSFHIKMTQSDPDWDPTTLGFDFIPQEDATLVRFSHMGWPECNSHFRRSSYCWALLLTGLKNYVERGEIIPFEERS